jgi:hypothetical protein
VITVRVNATAVSRCRRSGRAKSSIRAHGSERQETITRFARTFLANSLHSHENRGSPGSSLFDVPLHEATSPGVIQLVAAPTSLFISRDAMSTSTHHSYVTDTRCLPSASHSTNAHAGGTCTNVAVDACWTESNLRLSRDALMPAQKQRRV